LLGLGVLVGGTGVAVASSGAGVSVGISVGVLVGIGVQVGVLEAVGVSVGIKVGVKVSRGVLVGVGVGCGARTKNVPAEQPKLNTSSSTNTLNQGLGVVEIIIIMNDATRERTSQVS
jgi:hypothetical protein